MSELEKALPVEAKTMSEPSSNEAETGDICDHCGKDFGHSGDDGNGAFNSRCVHCGNNTYTPKPDDDTSVSNEAELEKNAEKGASNYTLEEMYGRLLVIAGLVGFTHEDVCKKLAEKLGAAENADVSAGNVSTRKEQCVDCQQFVSDWVEAQEAPLGRICRPCETARVSTQKALPVRSLANLLVCTSTELAFTQLPSYGAKVSHFETLINEFLQKALPEQS